MMKIKAKAKAKNGVVKAKMLVKHPMETGRRKDKKGKLIPANHITEVSVEYKNNMVFHAEFGPGVSKDPFLAFAFQGASGDRFTISVIDTKGITGKTEVTVK